MTRREIYEAIVGKNLEIDCVEMELKQCCDDAPLILTGAGFIKQSSNGRIEFIFLYNNQEQDSIRSRLQFLDSMIAGSLVPKEYFFDLIGKDVHGYRWSAEKLFLNTSINVSDNAAVIKGYIERLELREVGAQEESTSFCEIVAEGDHQLPWSRYRDQPNGYSSLCEIQIKIENVDINIFSESGNTTISLVSSGAVDLDLYKKYFIQGLSILIGKKLLILYEKNGANGKATTSINSNRYHIEGSLEKPIKIWMPNDLEKFETFLGSYISCAVDKGGQGGLDALYGYWHKIYLVSHCTVQAGALACGVSIEGLLKEYFKPRFSVSKEERDIIEDSLKVLKGVKLHESVGERLKSAMGNFRSKSPKRVLLEICNQHQLAVDLVKVWVKLRNKSAHADDLGMDQQEFESYFFQYRTCLYLFYRLMFLVVGYSGGCIDYTSVGCPEVQVGENA